MTRTFLHSFEPAAAEPVSGASLDLEVSDIADVGIREVLQTPGAAYGAWSILDALLAPTGTGTPFIFKEPLRQTVRTRLTETVQPDEFARPERAGGWIVPLGQERRITGGT